MNTPRTLPKSKGVQLAHEYALPPPKGDQAFVKGSVLSASNNIKRRHIWSTRGFTPCRELTEPPLLWAYMSCASDSWWDRTQLCTDQHVSAIHCQVCVDAFGAVIVISDQKYICNVSQHYYKKAEIEIPTCSWTVHFGDGGFPVTFTARSLEAKYIVEHTATRE